MGIKSAADIWLCKRSPEFPRRRSEQELCQSGRDFRAAQDVLASSSPSELERRYLAGIKNDLSYSITQTSTTTYKSGWAAWITFCSTISCTTDSVLIDNQPHMLALAFGRFLHENGKSYRTISQYLSHVQSTYDRMLLLSRKIQFRSDNFAALLDSYKRQQAVADHNKDCTDPVAITYPLYCQGLQFIENQVSWSLQLQSAVSAAWALGYLFSLRPNEYLLMTQKPDHCLQSHSTYLGWLNPTSGLIDFFPISSIGSAPIRLPSAIYSDLPFTKSHQFGDGNAKLATTSSSSSDSHLPIHVIWTHFYKFRVNAGVPLLYSDTAQVSIAHIRDIMSHLATSLGISTTRLTPHNLRRGVPWQAHSLPDDVINSMGDWSNSGSKPYKLRHSSVSSPSSHSSKKRRRTKEERIRSCDWGTAATISTVSTDPTAIPISIMNSKLFPNSQI